MKYVLTGKEAQAADRVTREKFNMDDLVLMERAALSVADEIKKRFSKDNSILIVAGTGNNGADGVACARILYTSGFEKVSIYCPLGDEKATDSQKRQLKIAKSYGMIFVSECPEMKDYDVIVDALFGTGLNRQIEGKAAETVELMNRSGAFIVAVDTASGIDHVAGAVNGPCVRADLTVTFAFLKRGQLLFPGKEYSGETVLSDIGITKDSFEAHEPECIMLEKDDVRRLIPKRRRDSHKGTFGKVLCIAGSVGMAGAAYFSAKASALSGAGLVRIYSPEENRVILQEKLPEAVITAFYEKHETENLIDLLSDADSVLIGSGIGKGKAAREILDMVLREAQCPVVLDADALNIIAEDLSCLKRPHTELILTPHMGELSRLLNEPVSMIRSRLFTLCGAFSRDYQVDLIAKDSVTVIFEPYRKTAINTTGDDSLSTAGSGDILSGIVAGLIASGTKPSDAARLAPFIHGLAGEGAGKKLSRTSVTAQDILDNISSVFSEVCP